MPDPKHLEAEEAPQQGRVYLPTRSLLAVIVVTMPWMGAAHTEPIPASLSGFIAGWPLTPTETAEAKRMGIPIF